MKEFLTAHTVEAVGIITAAITAIGVFLGPWFASWRQIRNAKQDRKLRAHFEELKREAELVISSASNLAPMARDFSIVVAVGSQAVTTSDIEEAKVSASFEAHFPERAKGLGTLKQETSEHNANCENFRQKIKMTFESQGIPAVQNDQGNHSICIFEAALDALFARWRSLAQNTNPLPDFQKIVSESANGGYLLYASGWGASAVAFAKTENDLEKCKVVLAEIADDLGNQREATKIVASANELVEKAREFANQLATKLDEIDKYWPGTQTNKFKRLKKTCPKCKELF